MKRSSVRTRYVGALCVALISLFLMSSPAAAVEYTYTMDGGFFHIDTGTTDFTLNFNVPHSCGETLPLHEFTADVSTTAITVTNVTIQRIYFIADSHIYAMTILAFTGTLDRGTTPSDITGGHLEFIVEIFDEGAPCTPNTSECLFLMTVDVTTTSSYTSGINTVFIDGDISSFVIGGTCVSPFATLETMGTGFLDTWSWTQFED